MNIGKSQEMSIFHELNSTEVIRSMLYGIYVYILHPRELVEMKMRIERLFLIPNRL